MDDNPKKTDEEMFDLSKYEYERKPVEYKEVRDDGPNILLGLIILALTFIIGIFGFPNDADCTIGQSFGRIAVFLVGAFLAAFVLGAFRKEDDE